MAEKKSPPVTLVKGNRKVTTSLPREIVQYKAAGWAEEEPAARPAPATTIPVADSPQDTTAAPAPKGGAKK